jgi:adenylosuccinate lyase
VAHHKLESMNPGHPLFAISPVDGRYHKTTEPLTEYFSEYALFRYRCLVEVEYFIALCELPLPQLNKVDTGTFPALRRIYEEFSIDDALRIKEIEKTTNHDIKAVEYFLKEKMKTEGLEEFSEFIHFGLTSQDINNTAIPLSLKEAYNDYVFPLIEDMLTALQEKTSEWAFIPMLARTHGQAASPTRLGKEIEVFTVRLQTQLMLLSRIPFAAKFGGATGNFNAHYAAYPQVDWQLFANDFVKNALGLIRSYPTTQIEHYDHLAAFCHAMTRLNTILIDCCRDFWTYIMLNYFTQKTKEGEVGSSAMPHKVNPIDFENAEGNLGVANALFSHLAEKLPVSRLQRDLTDSTVLRNLGIPVAHSIIAYKSFLRGLAKLEVNETEIRSDLEKHPEVLAEAIQTILRRENYPHPYEALKDLTRGNAKISMESLHRFIDSLDVNDHVKKELKLLTPFNYIGK